MANMPDGWIWTDDMTIPLPPGRTVEELVDSVIQAAIGGTLDDTTEHALIATFGRSPEDAALARDRTLGGIVRASTRNPANCPARDKDPLAWTSYHRARQEPSIIATIYPQYVQSKRWWPFWK